MVIWYILWQFGYVVAIWYIFPHFGILCQEKSGNPERNTAWHKNHCSFKQTLLNVAKTLVIKLKDVLTTLVQDIHMGAETIAQFFKQKSSWASQEVCRPGAEPADKFILYFTKQVCRPSAEPADKLVGWLIKNFVLRIGLIAELFSPNLSRVSPTLS
jgi:hypothetical protein